MSENQIENLLADAKLAFNAGVSARGKGDIDGARQSYLMAANKMMLAADQSVDRLRQSRIQIVQEILNEVESLGKPAVIVSSGANSSISINEDDKSNEWLIQERPDVRFEDVAGLEGVKEQIRIRLLYPFTHSELAEEYGIEPGGGILLFGPPGTGKTLIARAVAGEVEAAFYAIKPSEIMSQWVGKAEENLAKLFKMAGELPLSVIFIDEMESLAPKRRSTHSTVMKRVVPQLLAELDGFHQRKNPLLFIGATNEPWGIDPAILRPGRLDRLIYVPPPDQDARRKILELNLKRSPLAQDLSLEDLAVQTQGFSGADMAALIRRVRERVFLHAIQEGASRLINIEDFQIVLSEMKPSIILSDLEKFERYNQGR